MKKTVFHLATACLIAAGTLSSAAQSRPAPAPKTAHAAANPSKDAAQAFFTAFGKGDFEGIVNAFHESCTITAVREAGRTGAQVYGTYRGKVGVKSFLANLGSAFDTKAFAVANVVGEGPVAFANGTFTHLVKSSGQLYTSDWALMCVVKDGKILEYHFYEDSEKFAEASKKALGN